MAKCKDCKHFDLCEVYGKTVDFDVDDGVCKAFFKDEKIVRCKECFWFEHPAGCPIHASKMFKDGEMLPREDDYCSCGERK